MISDACAVKLQELRDNKTLKTKYPDVTLAFILHEAGILYEWCQPDKDALIRVNLDWKIVEDLPLRIEALKSIEAVWNSERKSSTESQKIWKEALPPAIMLKKEIKRTFLHAYKKNKHAYTTTQLISEGNNYVSLIQCLGELSVLGKKNPDELIAIHFDMSLLDAARDLSFSLGYIWAHAIESKSSRQENLKLRNKAFYHLKEGLEAIRSAGKYAFHNDKERIKGYHNGWSRKKYHLSKKIKKQSV